MDNKDFKFKPFHNTLSNLSKQLLNDGVGATKKQAKVISELEEKQLWGRGVLGNHTPTSLQNSVFYYCGLFFCLRGGEEHRELSLSQFEVKEVPDPIDKEKKAKCIIYTVHGSKNH